MNYELPYRYEAVNEFLMFLRGKHFKVTVSGNRISTVGMRFTHPEASWHEGETLTFQLLYEYAASKFFCLRDREVWREI